MDTKYTKDYQILLTAVCNTAMHTHSLSIITWWNFTLPIKGCLVPCSLLIAADSSKEMENVEFCVHWLWR